MTGTGARGDLALVSDAGAVTVLDFRDTDHATIFLLEPPVLEEVFGTLLDALVAAGAEVDVLEVADGLYQRETAMLVGSALSDAV